MTRFSDRSVMVADLAADLVLGAADKSPVVRSFSLPNGSKIVSLRESTLRAGLKAANLALKAELPGTRPFDVAACIISDDAAAEYLADALESGSPVFIDYALWVAAGARLLPYEEEFLRHWVEKNDPTLLDYWDGTINVIESLVRSDAFAPHGRG